MLRLHFFVDGHGFTYYSHDTGDLEKCDVGMILTGMNQFHVIMPNNLWDTDSENSEAEDTNGTAECDQQQDALCIAAKINAATCTVTLNKLDLQKSTLNANMSASELASLGIFLCKVKLQHLTAAQVLVHVKKIPLLLRASNLCLTCSYPAKSFSALSHHIYDEHKD